MGILARGDMKVLDAHVFWVQFERFFLFSADMTDGTLLIEEDGETLNIFSLPP